MGSWIDKTVYHGSDRIIKLADVDFLNRRENCDFGKGFYVTENKLIAEEWVCNKETPVINAYRMKVRSSDVLHLEKREWVAVVSFYRENIGSVMLTSEIICGTIANDRMDDSFSLFLDGVIGDLRLIKCLDYCKLGNQFCFRSSADCLTEENSYELKGLELQKASERFYNRRSSMESQLRLIRRQSIEGELFVEDYVQRGGYSEKKLEL